jgi:hypothetical protein
MKNDVFWDVMPCRSCKKQRSDCISPAWPSGCSVIFRKFLEGADKRHP